jgi:hypothetical protein
MFPYGRGRRGPALREGCVTETIRIGGLELEFLQNKIAWLFAIIARSEDLQDKFRFLVKVFERLTKQTGRLSCQVARGDVSY